MAFVAVTVPVFAFAVYDRTPYTLALLGACLLKSAGTCTNLWRLSWAGLVGVATGPDCHFEGSPIDGTHRHRGRRRAAAESAGVVPDPRGLPGDHRR